MRAIRTTCASFGFALVAAMAATPLASKPASAAACADFFPFVCLFGPEAEAMQPAPAVPETWTVALALQSEPPAVQQRPRRKQNAASKPRLEARHEAKSEPKLEAKVEAKVEAKSEAKAEPAKDAPAHIVAAAETKQEPAPMSMPLRLGPGPAFAMSLRLSPSMREEVTPPTSACVIEQTFNQLFPLRDVGKLAENDVKPAHPLMMVAVKTGTSPYSDLADAVADEPSAPVLAAAAPQDMTIK